ncbi:sirohydrochlorin ferrochelatase [Antricoccus suffuscus]|uniref:Sirohydrochlorin ferrochelatase n=1 Tax=Antricoccus suffuscus TaxID=1629062 RepID=A0A2T1A6R9_9ACTN|nr:sirohydrochlorin chelatase [Antricoccus suffuscus]PRZ44290.1 sirohydrochlorin ferrochelatase [Antricoccus suffuscus]
MPSLIGCSHGTDSVDGRATVRALLNDVATLRPDLDVHEAFVDVQEPRLDAVVDGLAGPHARKPHEVVVVPLLLSGGYHVNVDVMEAVAAVGGNAVAAGALGPDPRLTAVLVDRLNAVGVRPGDAVVLAAAGSSDPRAQADIELVAQDLRAHHQGPVTIGFGSIAKPALPDAVSAARQALSGNARVVVAAYLLAPGFFYDKIRAAGADLVTAPLAPDARLTAIVLDRFSAAVRARGHRHPSNPVIVG